jgi:hypothetical protein
MLFRDLHEFANPEFVEQLLSQTVPESLLLIAGIVLAMPIIMVPLNHLLPPVWSRWANLLVVLIIAVSFIANPPGDLDDYWFTALEVLGLAAIAWLAWRWRPEFTPSIPDGDRPNRRSAHPGS